MTIRAVLMRAERGQRRIHCAQGGGDERLALVKAGIGHKIACIEIIRSIGDDIIGTDQSRSIVSGDACGMRLNCHMRVDARHGVRSAIHLRAAHIGRAVNDLALKIGKRHGVVIDNPDRANASGS